MESFNVFVGRNIAKFRKFNKLTQTELAEKLNFSDKSVSKWERGESLPELEVLKNMCDLFGITLNDLVEQDIEPQQVAKHHSKRNRYLITFISAGGVWVLATIIFVVLLLIDTDFSGGWLSFIYAVPTCLVVLLVFACVWGKKWMVFSTISALLWTIIISICISSNNWLLLYIGIPLQVLTVLAYFIKTPKTEKNKKNVEPKQISINDNTEDIEKKNLNLN